MNMRLRYMGLEELVSLMGPLYLIGMWLCEDQRANIIKDTCLKNIGLRLPIQITTLHSTMNTTRRTYVSD